jgi:hypothetical protein
VPPVTVTRPFTVTAPGPNRPLILTLPEFVPSGKKFVNEPITVTMEPTIEAVLCACCTPGPNGFAQFSCPRARPESLGKSRQPAISISSPLRPVYTTMSAPNTRDTNRNTLS